MTVIVDIPQSGIYFQQGAIVQIVAQILDASTGLPVQLQTATGLSISILYPDGVTSQTFAAQLFTDGSDGQIVYTTQNNGSNIVDLSQVGLYHFQGNGAIGGVNLPPSYEGDFYVLPNVSGLPGTPLFNASAVIFFDSTGVRWAMTVTPTPTLVTAVQPTGPASYLQFSNLYMKDSNGIIWLVTISTIGVVSGTLASGQINNAITSFLMNDVNGLTRVITISTTGQLQAA